MASWLITRVFWITCLAVVSYAFPSIDGNSTASYSKKIDYLKESADQETFNITYHGAVLTATKDSEDFAGLSETSNLNNGMIAVMNVSRCDVKHKTGHCVRNKRSTRGGELNNGMIAVVNASRCDVKHKTGHCVRNKRSSRGGPHFCDDTSMDTITRVQNGETYIFKGNLYWKLHNHAIPEGFPRTISDDWDGLEGPLDAAYTTHEGETLFFKGSQYWKYVNKRKQDGYPKQISVEFEGIPDEVDAAFSFNDTQQVYFFKGRQYWLHNKALEPPVQGYPQPIRGKWGHLLRKGIDAAFLWQNKRIYFFKDDVYYNYNFETFRVVEADPPYPRATGPVWFDCR